MLLGANWDLVVKAPYSYISDNQIKSNADLNNYTTPGAYTCINNVIAATLSNCPVSYAFRLEVRQLADVGRYVQTLYANDKHAIYYRNYLSNGWNNWTRVGSATQAFGNSGKKIFALTASGMANGTDSRGNILISCSHQNSTKNPALLLASHMDGGFSTCIQVTPTTDSIVESVTISGETLYITYSAASSWSSPVILPMFVASSEIQFTGTWVDSIPS